MVSSSPTGETSGMSFKANTHETNGVIVIDLEGRLTLGGGSATLRALIRDSLGKGHRRILINLAGVNYIDSSGLGELVSGYRAVKAQGGELKLMNLGKKVNDLLRVTKLYTIFDIHQDEPTAVASFRS
jgi:anti-sigma B factor antagonist